MLLPNPSVAPRPPSCTRLGATKKARVPGAAAREAHPSRKGYARVFDDEDDIIFRGGAPAPSAGDGDGGGSSSLERAMQGFAPSRDALPADVQSWLQPNPADSSRRNFDRIDDLQHMLKKSLQALCVKYGLKAYGTRDELIDRILTHESKHPQCLSSDSHSLSIEDIFTGLA